MNRKFHPMTNIFPLLQGLEFDNLCQNVAENGLLESIWIHSDESIIDGRVRYLACRKVKIKPHFRIWNGEGNLLNFIIYLNLHRRHLTNSQRAAIAVEILPFWEIESKKRQGNRSDLNIPQLFAECSKGESREQVAKIMGTNRQYVSDAKRIKRDNPILFEQIKEGKLSIKEVSSIVFNVHFSSNNTELYTPIHIVEKIINLWESIDLDPCSNDKVKPNIPAKNHFTKSDNGLEKIWYGKVFINPPYGKELILWIIKTVESYETKEINEAIILAPSRTDTEWFRKLRDYPKCFIYGRLKFVGLSNSAPFPSMLVYIGCNTKRFCTEFRDIGDIYYWEDNFNERS